MSARFASCLALGLVLLLAAGAARAQADAEAEVVLEWADGAWNGISSVTVPANATQLLVWVPADARVHAVTAIGADGQPQLAGWRAHGPNALRVDAPEGARAVNVSFDVGARGLFVATYEAPAEVATLTIRVAPPPGQVVESPAAAFDARADGAHVAALGPLPEGARVGVRAVAADRVAELPVALAIGGLALVVLMVGVAWHKLRPPLAGRPAARFLDHLQELQARLVPPLVAFGALNVLYFVMGLRHAKVGSVPIVAPTFGTERSLAVRAFEAMAERLVPEGVALVVLRPADAVLVQVQVTLFLAFATVLPLLAYELARFVAPALTQRERRVSARVVPLVLALFLAGAFVGFALMAPLMVATLYGYAPALGAAPLLAVGDLVSFALIITLALALAAELPVVMYVLARIGLVRAATFRRYLRHAVVIIFVLAGVLTPDPSVVTQAMVGLPLTALYALGMLTARLGEGRRQAASGEPAASA